jgi:ABC-type lipoprotein export system ATPase subunit
LALIEIEEVSKVFGFGAATTLALDEASLSVEKGEFIAIMGPSGSGKTTLMNIIGLLDKPTNGNYLLGGKLASRLRPNQQAKLRRDRIGFVFQFYNLLPNLNVLELLAEVHRQGNTILLVTHNPELTRFANRVIYMYDGMIVGDEKTAIGQMARGARRTYFKKPKTTDDDIAAGVSALLKDVPGKEVTTRGKRKKAKGRKRSLRRRGGRK